MYLTGDEHHDHFNIIKYEDRDYKTKAEMTKAIVGNYFATVPEGSMVIHVGDFSMVGTSRVHYYQHLAKEYNKKNISRHLVLGNHDELKPFTYVNIELFKTVHTAFWMPYYEYTLVMSHDPAVYDAIKGPKVILIHAHVHKLYRTIPGRRVFNAGVDVNNYRPVHIDEIVDTLKGEGTL